MFQEYQLEWVLLLLQAELSRCEKRVSRNNIPHFQTEPPTIRPLTTLTESPHVDLQPNRADLKIY